MFSEAVARFSDALFAVFDHPGRTTADTRHAVRAFLSPHGFPGCEPDVVQRAVPDTLPAADAGISDPEGVGFDKEPVERRIDRTAHEAVVKIVPRRGKGLIRPDARDDLIDDGFRLFHDHCGFLSLRGPEHRNVVFGHDDLCRPHVAQLLFSGEQAVVFCRVSDLAAAVHDEPDAFRADKLRSGKPVGHDPRGYATRMSE